jgi:hypothetical protein
MIPDTKLSCQPCSLLRQNFNSWENYLCFKGQKIGLESLRPEELF